MGNIKKEFISWEQFHKDTKTLSSMLKKRSLNFKGIVAISRGGLVPASIIASELNITNVELVAINSYDKTGPLEEFKVYTLPNHAIEDMGKGWLVVDELVDTGSTFIYLNNILPHSTFVSVYTKNLEIPYLQLYVKEFSKDTWLCLPWEVY